MLFEFYGTECPHCQRMEPLIKRLQEETGAAIEQYEVWHNEENAKKMNEYDKSLCGGVPFFFNTDSKEFICGEASYEELKNWAQSKKKIV